jgi:NAD(P)-dependent dehydrogenase (short-subunit alcohol dehydrogenase family)
VAVNCVANSDSANALVDELTRAGHRAAAFQTVLAAMNALGRLAGPDEIASVVAFLLSSDAGYITGATLDAAGGWI